MNAASLSPLSSLSPISAIWQGSVRHRRFAPRAHAFSYSLFMLGLDLDEVETRGLGQGRWFGVERAGLLSFYRQDYLKGSSGSLKQAVWQKVAELGGRHPRAAGVAARECALSGFLFQPGQFLFLLSTGERPLSAGRGLEYSLERAPLLPAGSDGTSPPDKDFHVSPFMDLAMRYHWRIRPPEQETLIHIESHPQSGAAKLFDATLALRREPLSRQGLMALLVRWPWMTLKVLLGIYWQALRLFIKRTPIFRHPETH